MQYREQRKIPFALLLRRRREKMRKNTIKTTSMITASRIKIIVLISGDSSAMPSGSTAGKRDRQMK